jgi:hypothetical protein
MIDLERFLHDGIYRSDPAAATPLSRFRREFVRWLDCPARQLAWCQHRRIEYALEAQGFSLSFVGSIGRDSFGSTHVLGLSGPGARQISTIQIGWVVGTDG